MPKPNNGPSDSTISFVRAVGCKSHIDAISKAIADFGDNVPTEDEVLSRCRLAFEYMVHETMKHSNAENWNIEVEIQLEE